MKKNKPVATVNIVSTDGSTPRGIGSTMLVGERSNLIEGTIGGGILEEKAKQDAVNCIANKENKLINYALNNSSGNDKNLHMKCGEE
nr:XdhC family protein [Anaerosalibacter massiliensis]